VETAEPTLNGTSTLDGLHPTGHRSLFLSSFEYDWGTPYWPFQGEGEVTKVYAIKIA
jgi:hypothetical protein